MGIMKTLTINGETFNLTPVVPTSSVTLSAKAWVGDGDTYSQVVELPGVGLNTKVDLQPTPEQLEEFHYFTLGFVAENEGGIITVYAIGDKPTNDHTIQVTLTEVEAEGKIRGNTVGTTIPRADWNQEDPTKADYIKNKPTINDQTPTFAQASVSENIVSGENLSTIFGKVMRAIADLASHSGNNNNPHSVSAEQVGARSDTWMPSASDVGARPNTWLPTIAEIGAAPAGYGYGGTAVDLKDDPVETDEELATLIEAVYSTMKSGETKLISWPGFPATSTRTWYGMLARSSTNNGSLVVHGALNQGTLLSKTKYSGEWKALEWINPPMEVGVEYRTTDRYNSKPVYRKLVSCGTITANTPAAITYSSDTNCRPISVVGANSNGIAMQTGLYCTVNSSGAVGTIHKINFGGYMNYITIESTATAVLYVTVKYYKTTD